MSERRLSLLQAVSVNMAMMVGVGPFITIPLFVATMGGPQSMIGWVLGAVVAICDGLVWSELASAFPGSGGTYHFFDAIYGQKWLGRLLKFLFVWQFLFSGPLEIATGALGLGAYASYLFPVLETSAWSLGTWVVTYSQLGSILAVLGIVMLAYRRIEAAGRLMVIFWAGMLATVGVVLVASWSNFDARIAFDFPPGAWTLDSKFAVGLGAALGIAMYDYLGYYQVCYLGDEVENPSKTIPRSILISVVAVSALYMFMNLGIMGAIPWRMVIASKSIASDLLLHVSGTKSAAVITVMILWTGTAATFSAILGYSRIPYAAAKSGHFFRGLAATHPKGDFPHRSLILIGLVAAFACLAEIETVIAALLTSRILIQFVGQIITVWYIRSQPHLAQALRFRMWFYPLPALVALIGWLWVFCASPSLARQYGILSALAGIVVFVLWDRWTTNRLKSDSTEIAGVSGPTSDQRHRA